MKAGTPFRAARMMFAALEAAMALPLQARQFALHEIGAYKGRGKGGGKHPRRSSARFVAQDKRDARKARNRK